MKTISEDAVTKSAQIAKRPRQSRRARRRAFRRFWSRYRRLGPPPGMPPGVVYHIAWFFADYDIRWCFSRHTMRADFH